MVKIIFGKSIDKIEQHARKLVVASEEKARTPMGVPAYSAMVPEICEDCGSTYWHRNDEYGWFPHIGCKGSKVKDTGF